METADWLYREMASPQGGFYAALDADSEGEEGKFYTWTNAEIDAAFETPVDAKNAKKYFSATEEGNWEEGRNIFYKTKPDRVQAMNFKMEEDELQKKVKEWKKSLLDARQQRVKPGLDDKIISGWNGMAIKGLSIAYGVFEEDRLISLAKRAADFLISKMTRDGVLYHNYKEGKLGGIAFLEDYAAVIDGYLHLYQVTFEERWVKHAEALLAYTLEHFYDTSDGFFFYTDERGEKLISRNKELFDNVIPASNSVMAHNLFFMGKITSNQRYTDLALRMLSAMAKLIDKDLQYLGHWASLYACQLSPTFEVALVGPKYLEFMHKINKAYHPNKVMAGSASSFASLPLLKERLSGLQNNHTSVHVCFDNTCGLPVHSAEDALKQMGG
jgi:hypothetical protein